MGKNLEIGAVIDIAPAATLAEEVTKLFLAYRAPLLRYLLSLGLSVEAGEEVVQEVFLSLFHHLRQDKSREHLRGWIFRVGHNLALKERHRDARRPQVSLDEHQPCPAPDPEQSASQSQRQRRILAIVRALPPRDQQCLHLRAEGLRYREIAQVLGISLGAVALTLSRALLKVTEAEASR
jgi:RNA polymerase sigma-70 factor (ECF subfamily)